jgi:SRSO17 transposase
MSGAELARRRRDNLNRRWRRGWRATMQREQGPIARVGEQIERISGERSVGSARPGVVLVIDDTAIPKKGTHSVGVAAQYASALGKTSNCQTLVSLTLARGEVPVMLALRLFLPESWTINRVRLERAGVPTEYRTARTKREMALTEIDRVIAAGVRFGCVLADAGYGMSAPFRHGLTARKLAWAVGIPRHQKV